MTYFDRTYGAVEYDESLETVVGRIHDYAEGEEFRAYMNAIIDAVEATGSEILLADSREMGPIAQEDQVWSIEDWSPRAESAGLSAIAFVMPESVIAGMSFERVMSMAEGDDIDRAYFEDPAQARDWLRDWSAPDVTAEPGGQLQAE
ncbi:hypothetical protein BRC81_09920 [Halobacteriales archaeon QS_1_68_20]|nr:MAG: hypothetical protein BRC81_09920 [Halobacteriales archaeon QS_1_68_20]